MPGVAFAAEGKGKPDKSEKTTGLDRAAEAKAEAEARAEVKPETKPEVSVPVVVPVQPEPKKDPANKESAPKTEPAPKKAEVSIPTPVKPIPAKPKPPKPVKSPKPVLGDPPVEPDDPVCVWVNVNPSHLGTTAECAARWHFVLVGLGKGASAGRLTVVFEKAGKISVDPSKINLQMQHFEVYLPSGDKLLEAYAQVMLPQANNKVRLNLSDVTCVCPPPPPPPPSDEPTCPPPPPPPPPSDEPTCPPPPADKPEKPSTPKPEPKPEPVPEVIVKPKAEPYLPLTGGNLALFLGLSTVFGTAGLGLRRLGAPS